MSSRLEIELTSSRPDGVWTWRKAGAKMPKGEVEASKLPAESKLILAKIIVKGHQDFEPVYGQETSPFPALAQMLSKVAKSEPVTKTLAQLQ